MNPSPSAYSARSRVIVIAIFIALGAYVLFGFSLGEGAGPSALQQREEKVVSGSFTVPGNKSVVSFSVPASSFDASMQGNFSAAATAQPSLPGQVEVYVMDSAELSDYQQGADRAGVTALYSSGDLTASTFDVQLTAAGTYYLVFALPGQAAGISTILPGPIVTVQAAAYLIYTTCSGSEC